MRELVEVFLTDAPLRIAALRRAAEAADAVAFRREAHTLKGNSATVGARAMTELCQGLEALGDSSSTTDVGPLIDRLEVEFGKVRVALDKGAP